MLKDLVIYEEFIESSGELLGIENVTFLRDFGPWKKGDKVETLWFGLDDIPFIEEQSKDGTIIKSGKFQLTFVP